MVRLVGLRETPLRMRVSAVRALRAIAASTRVVAAPSTLGLPKQTCALLGTDLRNLFSSNSRGWFTETRVVASRLKSTSGDDDLPDAAAQHERSLAAARTVQETMASGSGTAFTQTEVDRATAQVLRFLNYKPRTKAELFTKLVEDKLYDPAVATAAIQYLETKEIVSDTNYAEMWARYKWRTGKWAPRRIRASLQEKGIADCDANAGLANVFDDLGDVKLDKIGDDGDDDSSSPNAIAGEEHDKGTELVTAARKRWVLSRGMDGVKRRRRLHAWLERRGHGGGTSRAIVETLEREDQQKVWDEEDALERERGYRE
jgi:hypothetical protein